MQFYNNPTFQKKNDQGAQETPVFDLSQLFFHIFPSASKRTLCASCSCFSNRSEYGTEPRFTLVFSPLGAEPVLGEAVIHILTYKTPHGDTYVKKAGSYPPARTDVHMSRPGVIPIQAVASGQSGSAGAWRLAPLQGSPDRLPACF